MEEEERKTYIDTTRKKTLQLATTFEYLGTEDIKLYLIKLVQQKKAG